MDRAGEFRAPLLVLAAGADTIADPAASRAFVEAASSSDKTFALLPGFRHEIFNEVERAVPVAAGGRAGSPSGRGECRWRGADLRRVPPSGRRGVPGRGARRVKP